MTPPVLSLIVPNHNHTERLPRLFDSILAQSFKDLEVILVDDCSDSSCAPLVEAYRDKGLSISLLEHTRRMYTLQARLAGIRAAKGQIIAFADADDVLCGDNAMERNVKLFLRHMPDILHFRFSVINASGVFIGYADYEADPRMQFAYGEEVFSLFANSSFYHIAPVWNKYYSRDLCNTILEIENHDGMLRYADDLYLNSLYFYRADTYVSSDVIGYSYRYDSDRFIDKSKGRTVEYYYIMNFMMRYLNKYDCKQIYQECYKKSIIRAIAWASGRVCQDIYRNDTYESRQGVLDNLLTYADERTWINILLLGNGFNADKIRKIYYDIV